VQLVVRQQTSRLFGLYTWSITSCSVIYIHNGEVKPIALIMDAFSWRSHRAYIERIDSCMYCSQLQEDQMLKSLRSFMGLERSQHACVDVVIRLIITTQTPFVGTLGDNPYNHMHDSKSRGERSDVYIQATFAFKLTMQSYCSCIHSSHTRR
jgi:hypothetical protein